MHLSFHLFKPRNVKAAGDSGLILQSLTGNKGIGVWGLKDHGLSLRREGAAQTSACQSGERKIEVGTPKPWPFEPQNGAVCTEQKGPKSMVPPQTRLLFKNPQQPPGGTMATKCLNKPTLIKLTITVPLP